MTNDPTLDTTASSDQREGFPMAGWTRANAFGLGITYALFALFGDGAEALLGVAHDSIVRDLAILAGLLVGAAVFVEMRRRVMAPYVERSTWTAVAAGLGLISGFTVGFVIAGPPFDFILGAITLGTIGGALQWRVLRDHLQRPGRLLGATIAAWLIAGANGRSRRHSHRRLHRHCFRQRAQRLCSCHRDHRSERWSRGRRHRRCRSPSQLQQLDMKYYADRI